MALATRGCAALAVALTLAQAVPAAAARFGEPARWLQVALGSPGANAGLVRFGDVDGDGKADMALYDQQAGEAFVARSTGSGFAAPVRFATGLPKWTGRYFEFDLADVNGDRRTDMVVLSRGRDDVAGDATARVALSTGTAFAYPAQPVWNASWCAEYQHCPFGDLNGDGKADMAAFTPDFGTVWGSPSQGAAFGANAVWNPYFCIRGERCALGDVDGDGKADAILFKPTAPGVQKGNVLVARSTGGAFVDVRYGHGFFCIDGETCLVGDVNGDRRADIALVKGWGPGVATLEVLVSLSNGTSFINADPFLWARPRSLSEVANNFGTFTLADVTGDGRSDLVTYGGTYRAAPGGGSSLTGFAVDVHPVTDRPPPAPVGAPPTGTPTAGYASVAIYNCDPDQRRLHYWTYDHATGAWDEAAGPVDAMYSETGYCPDPADAPETVALPEGQLRSLVLVDPLAIGCDGRNDPLIVGCAKHAATFRGGVGLVCNWRVSAQAFGCLSTVAPQSGPVAAPARFCLPGFVWREARAADVVCVPPATREETWEENRRAPERVVAGFGPYGPATCVDGFVWREAFEGDVTCVTPDSRARAWADNAAASQRVAP
jgi:hypothetical protein